MASKRFVNGSDLITRNEAYHTHINCFVSVYKRTGKLCIGINGGTHYMFLSYYLYNLHFHVRCSQGTINNLAVINLPPCPYNQTLIQWLLVAVAGLVSWYPT